MPNLTKYDHFFYEESLNNINLNSIWIFLTDDEKNWINSVMNNNDDQYDEDEEDEDDDDYDDEDDDDEEEEEEGEEEEEDY